MPTATHKNGHYGADRGGRPHEGCDFSTPVGTPLYNTTPVKVMHVLPDPNSTGGKGVIVRDQYGTDYYYGHLDTIPGKLKPGMQLEPGTYLGSTGNSGVDSKGRPYDAHLHFEAWPGGKRPTKQGGTSANPESIDPNTGKPYLNVSTYNLDKDGNPINSLRTGDAIPSKFKAGRPLPEPKNSQSPGLNNDRQKKEKGLYDKPTRSVTPSNPNNNNNDPMGGFIKQRGLLNINPVHKMHDSTER
jgi:murein DD-endopeptidase MepM/ murein hydrolase activator NlpD